MVDHARQACVPLVHFVWKQSDTAKQVACLLNSTPACAVRDIHCAVERSTRATPDIDRIYPARGDVEQLPAGAQSATRPRTDGCTGRRARRARVGSRAERGGVVGVRTGVAVRRCRKWGYARCRGGVCPRPRTFSSAGDCRRYIWPRI